MINVINSLLYLYTANSIRSLYHCICDQKHKHQIHRMKRIYAKTKYCLHFECKCLAPATSVHFHTDKIEWSESRKIQKIKNKFHSIHSGASAIDYAHLCDQRCNSLVEYIFTFPLMRLANGTQTPWILIKLCFLHAAINTTSQYLLKARYYVSGRGTHCVRKLLYTNTHLRHGVNK